MDDYGNITNSVFTEQQTSDQLLSILGYGSNNDTSKEKQLEKLISNPILTTSK